MTSLALVRSTILTDTIPYAVRRGDAPGRLVFTAGACPLDRNGVVVSPGDIAAQAQRVMANLAAALGAAGAGLKARLNALNNTACSAAAIAKGTRTECKVRPIFRHGLD
jgi:enamine deaminase RidA (YjgF/YER057c/UK114 family)